MAPDARLGGPILDEGRELRDHLTALLTTVARSHLEDVHA